MITPTVGRVVWFWPPKDNAVWHANGGHGQPLCALIAHVWSDTCVNLAIFDANGCPVANPPTSVLLLQDGNPRPSEYFCEWMPYQKGQASKTEALEAVVRGISGTAQGVGMAV